MVERRDLPLFAWGAALRAARRRRAMLMRRSLFIAFGCACVGATIAAPPLPRLVWNASASAPLGLYAVAPGAPIMRGEMVIARVPKDVRDLAARRHYIPANVPLVKRVAAVSGDVVCATGPEIRVNQAVVATRLTHDRSGRALPWWRGCQTLRGDTVLLLMTTRADSFDGRYFGPTAPQDVLGKATPLWVR
ncbi:S26 family signal peptidase [Sphingomonas immobilis]|uniref:S26 family signal peptidase n=1 Tax=Sphingomonas immobilis TaxID=3063997 RepID=A0ABT9A167_9SPHN|nr:S26 family signal peptidase [Sphingomonas sp. CA1-15]MDO7843571.1 S26 family signal peptidase [Sphingomonas sp. CA1-15]